MVPLKNREFIRFVVTVVNVVQLRTVYGWIYIFDIDVVILRANNHRDTRFDLLSWSFLTEKKAAIYERCVVVVFEISNSWNDQLRKW